MLKHSMMKLGALILSLSVWQVHAYTWTACGDGASMSVQSVELNPSDVRRGKALDITILAMLNEGSQSIEGGTLSATVRYHGFKVYSTSNQLCNTVACPVQPGGIVSIKTQQNMPGWAPTGPYVFRFEGTGPSTNTLQHRRALTTQRTALKQAISYRTSEDAMGMSNMDQSMQMDGSNSQNNQLLVCVEVAFDMQAR